MINAKAETGGTTMETVINAVITVTDTSITGSRKWIVITVARNVIVQNLQEEVLRDINQGKPLTKESTHKLLIE